MALLHPEFINGRVQWVDSGMQRVIDKIHHGDGLLGWEGDDRLAVYKLDTELGPIYELWRLEEDEQYRRVVATQPGDPFDDTIILWLVQNDKRRKPDDWSIRNDIDMINEAVDAEREKMRAEWVREDIGPRLLHAVRKDDGY
jgi:hypothetical protein